MLAKAVKSFKAKDGLVCSPGVGGGGWGILGIFGWGCTAGTQLIQLHFPPPQIPPYPRMFFFSRKILRSTISDAGKFRFVDLVFFESQFPVSLVELKIFNQFTSFLENDT